MLRTFVTNRCAFLHRRWRLAPALQAGQTSVRAVPVKAEPLSLFVLSHYPTQNRFALLLEML
ncbi:hypothetical protein BK187_06825 [Brucella melitensis]|uniref:Uncharacterized protein n=6 Tax=Brucella TaxID=234 RepID=C0RJS4_BRUMB|nr:Hypothetical protein, conserved [Brucella canis ATCC 23365]ABY38408.1 Hypothetical protein, conserved [Brucella suis ATCC 23445]ACO01082.1 Hypothetical protein, conserved [Brucella melitensis ATCC 23457]AQQ55677.1 hypothetical protein ADS42_000255 [Brucella melitensis]ASU71498.1 hypothetical protein CJP69_04300 [Brucella abortus]ATN21179.1 hypothetical protein CRN66_16015 [Brucella canis]ATQ52309.1 hypothetical protein CS875_06545 [Brucella suis]EEW86610.1 predicted protein [Brucella meli